jgi:chromosome segregation ATPase
VATGGGGRHDGSLYPREDVMSRRVIWGIVAATFGAFLIHAAPALAQTSAKDVAKKTGEAAEAIKEYTLDRKDDAVAYARKLVSELEAKINELETQVSRAAADAQKKAQEELTELKAKRAKASQKLSELGQATSASWDRVKQGFADAYQDLHRAYERAAAEFRR